jgi:hypothetical protein
MVYVAGMIGQTKMIIGLVRYIVDNLLLSALVAADAQGGDDAAPDFRLTAVGA